MKSLDNLDALTRAELTYLARTAHQLERFESMAEFVKALIKKESGDLTDEEWNLLTLAYKNLINQRRNASRTLRAKAESESHQVNTFAKGDAETYALKVEEELRDLCHEVISLIEEKVPSNPAGKVNYYKMKADYYRYISECSGGSNYDDAVQNASRCYRKALQAAESEHFSPTDPTYLGLVLNYSVYCYDVLQETDRAYEMANEAFNRAIPIIDADPDDTKKETAFTLQLLRDNITYWNSAKAT